MRALYIMLIAALLWYKQFKMDLEKIGYVFNPYDPCVANKVINRKVHTIRFHVDDVMCSHQEKKVNDDFLTWLNYKYGEIGEVKATRGNEHDYLGMKFIFEKNGTVTIDMAKYVANMLDEFSVKLKDKDIAPTPAGVDLFKESTGPNLDQLRAQEFHTFVAKGLFLSKRSRPDIHLTITVLCTKVKDPKQSDWKKLVRMMKYLNRTKNDKLVLGADNVSEMKWFVDASFGVHHDFRSHTGGLLTFGKGAVQTLSTKQKLNTRSSTEAELVGVDDMSTKMLWTKLFMEEQKITVKKNILYQDNKSTILLEKNGKRSLSKQARAINICYFFLTNKIEKENVTV